MLRTLTLCGCIAALLAACDATNETPDEGRAGAPESIDSMDLVLGRAAGDTVRVAVSGLGGGTPALAPDTLDLVAGVRYTGYVRLGGDVDREVRAEAESHRYVYAFSSDGLTVTPTDRESQYTSLNLNDGDYAVGRTITATAAAAATEGTLTVRLLHFEGAPKGAAAEGGTEDVAVEIPVRFSAGA